MEEPSSQSSNSSDLGTAQLDALEVSTQPKGTKSCTKWGMKTFEIWRIKRNITVDFYTVSSEDLAETLRKYYAEVKGKDSNTLSPSAMVGLRAALHRHITSPPVSRTINIVKDKEFLRANQMFVAITKKYFQDGNSRPKHKKSIQTADMEKLNAYFLGYVQSPQILTEFVWFLLCFHFGRRGREGWVAMTKTTFQFCDDSEGQEYVTYTATETTKNHQGGYKQKDTDYADGRMYGKGVSLLKFLISKLHPDLDRLFQHPLKNFEREGPWYRKEPFGKDTMGKIMPNLSKKAGLSHTYTCHCVRASTITTLLESGVDPAIIIQITKHKNVSSLQHYVSDLSDKQQQKTHNILASALSSVGTSKDAQEEKELDDLNRRPEQSKQSVTVNQLPECNFELVDFDFDFDIDPFVISESTGPSSGTTSGGHSLKKDNLIEIQPQLNPQVQPQFLPNPEPRPYHVQSQIQSEHMAYPQQQNYNVLPQLAGTELFNQAPHISFNSLTNQLIGSVGVNQAQSNPAPRSFYGAPFNFTNCTVNFNS